MGETGVVNVPVEYLMLIFPGADDNHDVHLPSPIIDPKFQGPIRVEINNLGHRFPKSVEFHLIKNVTDPSY